MNSRSSVNETNLVNFSADLPSLSQLDTKDGLLSFPFDHLYACHSESSDRRQTLQLDKELEISTHCMVAGNKNIVIGQSPEVTRLTERLSASESQNKKLKNLLIYHLDLIQQQNDCITKKDKLYHALKLENESLKSKLSRTDKKVTLGQRPIFNPPPLVPHMPTATVTSTVVKSEPNAASQIMLNSFTELLLPNTRTNSFIYDSDQKTKTLGADTFALPRPSGSAATSYLTTNLGVSSILDSSLKSDNFKMIDNKRSFAKKEIKTDNRSEALYTVTSNSGNPIIQRIQRNRRRPGLGSLSRMTKTQPPKVEVPESSKLFEEDKGYGSFSVNKKSKMINTYGKSKTSNFKVTSQFTGSLSDRLRLIDTTPTGEDPYQLGEADMREQSPIPKLMLQKTNHGRMKICTDTNPESTSRRLYTPMPTETSTKMSNKIKMERYNLPSTYVHPVDIKKEQKTVMVQEPDLDLVKTEPGIDWGLYNPNKPGKETSLCDFSYGETPNNLATNILPSLEFQDLFSTDSTLNLETFSPLEYNYLDKSAIDKSKRRGVRTTSLIGANLMGHESMEIKRGADGKRGRKRALSTTGLLKAMKRENAQKVVGPPKPKLIKGKTACRGKKSPVPGMVTTQPYHTLVGDPDLSWYLGLDPDVKMEDVHPSGDTNVSSVEVPRWREKSCTSCYTMEGTENLDDKVFEKRHQKLEAEERRQLRWHMRRIREQRHVERLRQRQRDSWATHARPGAYTVWPHPQRDVHFIEITDTLPVMAFGEIMPDIPVADFMLPWVKTSKAMKRSKRSKTLH